MKNIASFLMLAITFTSCTNNDQTRLQHIEMPAPLETKQLVATD